MGEVVSMWRPVDDAMPDPRLGQRAKLRLRDGREVVAEWNERGVATAWWVDPGQIEERFFGFHDPVEWWPLGSPLSPH